MAGPCHLLHRQARAERYRLVGGIPLPAAGGSAAEAKKKQKAKAAEPTDDDPEPPRKRTKAAAAANTSANVRAKTAADAKDLYDIWAQDTEPEHSDY